ncbi:ABC transporter substrate-binding protein [Anaerotalea alkaliphila]|uniref:Carbohydrate ABC transporter substrate-binding protein n=1 Tax=Anaerotalea alkaliphila TaxID=2662126 RepID=A0A7X5HV92_9FIRM|nr:ABC transporter substrate-binding protein [Anaerotalea alkaliphila]NDL67283.1 carbohydrate ABC transporter substrate-binding protein [Anaerotalea alkaliphila]
MRKRPIAGCPLPALSLILILSLLLLPLSGCRGEAPGPYSSPTNEFHPKTIRILLYKVEILEGMDRLVHAFQASHPGIRVEVAYAGIEYGAALKGRFAAGEKPDIFNNSGYAEFSHWKPELADLSGEPWVDRLLPGAADPVTDGEGRVYGLPVNLEGYGYIYNKALFTRAGILEPPMDYESLAAAVEKLEAAGIVPFVNGYQVWWVLGTHFMNIALANREDPDAFVQAAMAGEVRLGEDPVVRNWIRMLDLTLAHGYGDPMTIGYNKQLELFAKGEGAMIQQGNWIQTQIQELAPELELGMLPIPVVDGEPGSIPVGVPSNWVVHRNSPVKEEAKEFLRWMAGSQEGQRILLEEFKFIPPFSDVPYTREQLGPLAVEVGNHIEAGRTLGWHWMKLPEGSLNMIGILLQQYVAGELSADRMLEGIERILQEM